MSRISHSEQYNKCSGSLSLPLLTSHLFQKNPRFRRDTGSYAARRPGAWAALLCEAATLSGQLGLATVTATVLWIGGTALIPRAAVAPAMGVAASARTNFTKDLTANGLSPILYCSFDSIAKPGPTPELKKSEVSRNFLSFGLLWALSTGS